MSKKKWKPKKTLSDTVLLLVKIVGPTAIVSVSRRLGGKQVYIPSNKTFDSEVFRSKLMNGTAGKDLFILKELIGMARLSRVCKVLGGKWMQMPSNRTLEIFARNEQMVKDFDGRNFDEVARKYELTSHTVYKIMNNHSKGRHKIMRRRLRDKNKKKRSR